MDSEVQGMSTVLLFIPIEILLHFNLAFSFPVFYHYLPGFDGGQTKFLWVFNFVILSYSRKFDAREKYMFYSSNVICTGTCLHLSFHNFLFSVYIVCSLSVSLPDLTNEDVRMTFHCCFKYFICRTCGDFVVLLLVSVLWSDYFMCM